MHQLSGLGGAGEDVFRDLDEEVGEVGVEVRPDHLAEITREHTSDWGKVSGIWEGGNKGCRLEEHRRAKHRMGENDQVQPEQTLYITGRGLASEGAGGVRTGESWAMATSVASNTPGALDSSAFRSSGTT